MAHVQRAFNRKDCSLQLGLLNQEIRRKLNTSKGFFLVGECTSFCGLPGLIIVEIQHWSRGWRRLGNFVYLTWKALLIGRLQTFHSLFEAHSVWNEFSHCSQDLLHFTQYIQEDKCSIQQIVLGWVFFFSVKATRVEVIFSPGALQLALRFDEQRILAQTQQPYTVVPSSTSVVLVPGTFQTLNGCQKKAGNLSYILR